MKMLKLILVALVLFLVVGQANALDAGVDSRTYANVSVETTGDRSSATRTNAQVSSEASVESSLSERSYIEARQRYMEAKQDYQEARQDFIDARNIYQREKNELRLRDVILKLQNFLIRSDQTMVSYLQDVKLRVSSNENIDAQTKANIISDIDEDISWLEAKQSEINGATTKQELISLSRQLKDKWDEIKPKHKIIAGIYYVHRIDGLLNKADRISDRIQNVIDEIKDQGKDTTRLEELLLDFDLKISEAATARQKAIETFGSIDDRSDVELRVSEGRVYIQQANEALIAAHGDLREILKTLKYYKLELRTQTKGEANAQI